MGHRSFRGTNHFNLLGITCFLEPLERTTADSLRAPALAVSDVWDAVISRRIAKAMNHSLYDRSKF